MISTPHNSRKDGRKAWWLAATLIVVGLGALLVAPHFWRRVGNAKVTAKGAVMPDAEVYRANDGALLVRFAGSLSSQLYLVSLRTRKVSIPSSDRGFVFLRGQALCKTAQIATIPLDGTEEKMDKANAMLAVQPQAFTFTSLQHQRVRVSLS